MWKLDAALVFNTFKLCAIAITYWHNKLFMFIVGCKNIKCNFIYNILPFEKITELGITLDFVGKVIKFAVGIVISFT